MGRKTGVTAPSRSVRFYGNLNFTFENIHVVQCAHPFNERYTEQLEVMLIQMYRVHRYMSLDIPLAFCI